MADEPAKSGAPAKGGRSPSLLAGWSNPFNWQRFRPASRIQEPQAASEMLQALDPATPPAATSTDFPLQPTGNSTENLVEETFTEEQPLPDGGDQPPSEVNTNLGYAMSLPADLRAMFSPFMAMIARQLKGTPTAAAQPGVGYVEEEMVETSTADFEDSEDDRNPYNETGDVVPAWMCVSPRALPKISPPPARPVLSLPPRTTPPAKRVATMPRILRALSFSKGSGDSGKRDEDGVEDVEDSDTATTTTMSDQASPAVGGTTMSPDEAGSAPPPSPSVTSGPLLASGTSTTASATTLPAAPVIPAAALEPTLAPIQKEGFLWRREGLMRKWNRKWCYVAGNELFIIDRQAQTEEVVPLIGSSVARVSDKYKQEFAFEVVSFAGDRYTFYAASQADKELWLIALHPFKNLIKSPNSVPSIFDRSDSSTWLSGGTGRHHREDSHTSDGSVVSLHAVSSPGVTRVATGADGNSMMNANILDNGALPPPLLAESRAPAAVPEGDLIRMGSPVTSSLAPPVIVVNTTGSPEGTLHTVESHGSHSHSHSYQIKVAENGNGARPEGSVFTFAIESTQVRVVPWEELTILNLLGSGGFHNVHKVRHQKTFTDMALKMFDNIATGRQVEEFVREASNLHSMRHPHCLSCLGICIRPDQLGILVEFMDGGDLGMVLRRGSWRGAPLTTQVLLTILVDTIKGLAYLHGMRMAHRDIKPRNILLDNRGSVKIGDFGLSGLSASSACFTERYASPEVLLGDIGDMRSDIYSFGLVIFECLCGQAPFSKYGTTHRRSAGNAFDSFGDIPPAIPDSIRDLIERCCSADANRRPNVYAIHEVLEKTLNDIEPLGGGLPIPVENGLAPPGLDASIRGGTVTMELPGTSGA